MAERVRTPSHFEDGVGRTRAVRIAEASDRLADVLETIDLEEDPALADAVVEALVATDTAYDLETERAEAHRSEGAGAFVWNG